MRWFHPTTPLYLIMTRSPGTYQDPVAQYDSYAEVYNYIISHAYDRKSTYVWVKVDMPG